MRLRHITAGLGILALTPAAALASWAPAVRVSPPGPAVYDAPDIALGSSGLALAAWVRAAGTGTGDAITGRIEVASRPSGSTAWSRPRALSDDGARAPRVAVDVRGDAAVAWIQGRGIVAAVRRARGGGWSVSRAVMTGGGVQDMRIAIDRAGRPTLMWSEARGDGFRVRLSVRASARSGWRARAAELATRGPAPPALALSPGAGALVAWSEGDRTRASRTAGGAFEDPVEVSSERSAAPTVALSPRGAGLAAWDAALPGGTSVVIGAGRLAAATGWGSPDDLGIGRAPLAALNDRGDAVVAWSRGGPAASQGVEAVTRRRGGAWQASTVVTPRTCDCTLRVGRVSIDGAGTALVGWRRDDRSGPGGGGAAYAQAGGGEWRRAPVLPGRTRQAPAVASAAQAGGAAVWAEAGAGGGVRAVSLR